MLLYGVTNFAEVVRSWSRTYLLTYLRIYLLTYLLTYLITYLLTCLLTYLTTYLFTYLLAYLLTYLLTYLITCLLTYLLTYLFTYLLITYLLTYSVEQSPSCEANRFSARHEIPRIFMEPEGSLPCLQEPACPCAEPARSVYNIHYYKSFVNTEIVATVALICTQELG
jgi:hypothetical protein